MTTKQYQRELKEILLNNHITNVGDTLAFRGDGKLEQSTSVDRAIDAILDLNERALPDWTPHKYSSEYHKQIKSIIGKGK